MIQDGHGFQIVGKKAQDSRERIVQWVAKWGHAIPFLESISFAVVIVQ